MNSARLRALGFAAAAAMMMVCAAICAAPADAAPGRAECRSAPSQILGHPVPYCVILPSDYDANKASDYPALYFLHGLGGNEQLLLNSGGMNMIQDLRDSKRIGEFLIVAPDAGRSFFINSRDGKVRYEDFFVREFLPYIESHYRVRAERKSRGITGVSMGVEVSGSVRGGERARSGADRNATEHQDIARPGCGRRGGVGQGVRFAGECGVLAARKPVYDCEGRAEACGIADLF